MADGEIPAVAFPEVAVGVAAAGAATTAVPSCCTLLGVSTALGCSTCSLGGSEEEETEGWKTVPEENLMPP